MAISPNGKRFILFCSLFLALLLLSTLFISLKIKGQVKELFQLNKALQEEGYYMAEFEFQLLGFAYLLDKGEFSKALTRLDAYHQKLSKREGLIHIPDFSSTEEEINFYLDLQNPKTGAFMDASAPFCTYFSVTENVIAHLDALFESLNQPLHLRHPLSFLNEIDTPERLIPYLDDISYVGWLGSRFPQTSFHFARDMMSNVTRDNVILKNNLYSFSSEWKMAMLQWMYAFQDKDTGLWGPKDKRTGLLRKLDVSNTYSIVKKFRNKNGENIYPELPLQHADKLFSSVLDQLSSPMPDPDELAEVHEYNLKQAKGIKLLLSRLWQDGTPEDRKRAKRIIEDFIILSFDNYYVKKDGAFSYYPNADHATVDGMSNMILNTTGAFSPHKQQRYWGTPATTIHDLGTTTTDTVTPKSLAPLHDTSDINSWRIYTTAPDDNAFEQNVWAVVYPRATSALDICELIPNIISWTETSTLSTGNWKSMADIKQQYGHFSRSKPKIFHQEIPYKEMTQILQKGSEVYVVGFDLLQVPRAIMRYRAN